MRKKWPKSPLKALIIYIAKSHENTLEDDKGKPVKLKPGAHADVTVEADPAKLAPFQA
jgi:hypothetical protein